MGVIFLARRRVQMERIAEYGITLKQVYLLGYARNHSTLTPSKAARLLFCDKPTASVIIANCIKKGWLSKTRSPNDKRSYSLRLESGGESILRTIEERSALRLDEDPLDVLDESERKTLGCLLERVRKRALELFE
jgi:DNA-binding MarR family transcriptional regulator